MAHLPSLQQITARLHHSPCPLSAQPSSVANIDHQHVPYASTGQDSTIITTDDTLANTTPPKLKVAINPLPSSTNTTTTTTSPFGRLKLPASAMMRSHSSSSTGSTGLATPKPTEGADDGKLALASDPFAMPETAALERPTVSRGLSQEGYIKGYKDVPSLAAIRERVNVRGSVTPQCETTIGETATTTTAPITMSTTTPAKSENTVKNDTSPLESASSASVSDERSLVGKRKEHPLQHAW